jgi:uncharacterized membrane protein
MIREEMRDSYVCACVRVCVRLLLLSPLSFWMLPRKNFALHIYESQNVITIIALLEVIIIPYPAIINIICYGYQISEICTLLLLLLLLLLLILCYINN